jgi:hypothetical protein
MRSLNDEQCCRSTESDTQHQREIAGGLDSTLRAMGLELGADRLKSVDEVGGCRI